MKIYKKQGVLSVVCGVFATGILAYYIHQYIVDSDSLWLLYGIGIFTFNIALCILNAKRYFKNKKYNI